jgi:hypothetical protein
MAADKWLVYHTFKEYCGDLTLDLDADTLKCVLILQAGSAAVTDLTNNIYGDLTNEHANASGYTTGGETLTGVTWTISTDTTTLDADDISWTSSGTITARYAAIYANVTRNGIVDPLICYSLLDNAPADVTATNGNTFAITIDANGILDISGGDTA